MFTSCGGKISPHLVFYRAVFRLAIRFQHHPNFNQPTTGWHITRSAKTMTKEDEDNLEFAREYWKRFWAFRAIERDHIPDGQFDSGEAAFRLLGDLERCYASKAYYACFMLSFAMIEIYLTRVERLTGNAKTVIRNAGLEAEIDWLRDIRNDLTHGNPNDSIKYHAGLDEGERRKLEDDCQRVFRLLHALPKRSQ
jgi:hypothetical protein